MFESLWCFSFCDLRLHAMEATSTVLSALQENEWELICAYLIENFTQQWYAYVKLQTFSRNMFVFWFLSTDIHKQWQLSDWHSTMAGKKIHND
jgi:hypothetical protein